MIRVPLIIKAPGKTAGGETEALLQNVDIFPTLATLAGLPVPASVQGRSFDALFSDPEQTFRECTYSRFRTADTVITDRYSYTRYANGETMLYDHQKDPGENNNVAGNPEYAKIVVKLERMLQARMREAERLTLVKGE